MYIFDGHCDTLSRSCCAPSDQWYNHGDLCRNEGDLDLERMRRLGGYAQFFACFGETYGDFVRERDFFHRQCQLYKELMTCCRTAEEGESAIRAGKVAAFLSVEGADLLDCDPNRLEEVRRAGVRAVTITWNRANALSGTSREEMDRGLSDRGRAFVRRMQDLGMLVDVSHLSDPGFWDVADLAAQADKPFFASHSSARALCSNPRNLTDGQFTAIIKARGVAGLNFCTEFLSEGEASMEDAVRHIEHFCALGGQESVALGGDWDGCSLPADMRDITALPALYERLLRLNYPESTVQAVFYHNMMRVVREVCTM